MPARQPLDAHASRRTCMCQSPSMRWTTAHARQSPDTHAHLVSLQHDACQPLDASACERKRAGEKRIGKGGRKGGECKPALVREDVDVSRHADQALRHARVASCLCLLLTRARAHTQGLSVPALLGQYACLAREPRM
eukprot:752013-Rhodomonas_salina.1